MRSALASIFALTLLPLPAFAAPVSKDTGAQLFAREGCEAGDESEFSECGCEVSVKYNELPDNAAISALVAPAAPLSNYCSDITRASLKETQDADWKTASAEAFGKKSYFKFHSQQELSFVSREWVNVLTRDYVYSGIEQGNSGVASTLYDVKTAAPVDFVSLINLEKIADANAAIQTQLTARKADLLPGIADNQTPAYIAPDGKCAQCVYVLRDDGLHAIFQQDTVAPADKGFIEVTLPSALINRPIITMAKGN